MDDKVLDEDFEMWWPKLESKISKILESNNVKNIAIRDDRELIEEILSLVRITAKRNTSTTSKSNINLEYNVEIFERLVMNFISGTEVIFDWDWEHTKSCLIGDNMKFFISNNGNFLDPNVEDESNDWGNRVGFLEPYRKLSAFIKQNHIREKHNYIDNENETAF